MKPLSRLSAIAARADRATPGPWELTDAVPRPMPMIGATAVGVSVCCVFGTPKDNADATFIAASRDDVPWLLERLAAAERVIRFAKFAVKDHGLDAEHEFSKSCWPMKPTTRETANDPS